MSTNSHSNEVSSLFDKKPLTVKQKLALIDAFEQTPLGMRGAFLRRHGIYASYISRWKAQRDNASFSRKPGRPPKRDPKDKRIQQLEKDLEQWKKRAQRAETIVEFQKKVSEILGIPLDKNEKS